MRIDNKMKVGILYGGRSLEHDVSIVSAIQAYNNIDKDKYDVYLFYLTSNNNLYTSKRLSDLSFYSKRRELTSNVYIYKENNTTYFRRKKSLKKTKLDILFPIVHGEGVEDGFVYSYVQLLGLPSPISDNYASCIAQDKYLTKVLLKSLDINVLDYIVVDNNDFDDSCLKDNKLQFPLIIKPLKGGSSIGINIANNDIELKEAVYKSFNYSRRLIIEHKLSNYKEFNCACFVYKGEFIPSLIEEVSTSNDYLTFDDKYSKEDTSTRTINPSLPLVLEDKIKSTTIDIYKKLDFFGVIRIDFLFDIDSNSLYVNEINTIPGSLAFYLYKDMNISYKELLDRLISESIIRNITSNKYITKYYAEMLNNNLLSSKNGINK